MSCYHGDYKEPTTAVLTFLLLLVLFDYTVYTSKYVFGTVYTVAFWSFVYATTAVVLSYTEAS